RPEYHNLWGPQACPRDAKSGGGTGRLRVGTVCAGGGELMTRSFVVAAPGWRSGCWRGEIRGKWKVLRFSRAGKIARGYAVSALVRGESRSDGGCAACSVRRF